MTAVHGERCGCGEQGPVLAPAAVDGAPRLSALVLENRAHGWPRAALLAAFSTSVPADGPTDPVDTGLILLDVLAYVADHVAYHQDAVATEGYLGTARSRASVRRHARLLDYEMHDGVGVSAEVVFLLEDEAQDVLEVPRRVTVRAPAAKDVPPTVLTTADGIEVRREWNAFRPRLSGAPDEAIERNAIGLAQRVERLPRGRMLIVHGVDAATGSEAAEVAIAEGTSLEDGLTTLSLAADLHHRYRRDSVRILGNVARATHGDLRTEVLGSGDASIPRQAFALSSGAIGTSLEVRVDGVAWSRVEGLDDAGPEDRVFVADDEGGDTMIRFGDGVHGARLPSGRDNVTASYRVGSGAAGNVDPRSISTSMARPSGLEAVTNPTPATGGADAETLEEARRNAPATIRSFGRLVSLRDYEDLALGFPGISKVTASRLWDGATPIVHISVASSDGARLEDDAALLGDLRRAVEDRAEPSRGVVVQSYAPSRFTLRADIRLDPIHGVEDVRRAVEAAVADAYAFERAEFGQVIEAADVEAVIRPLPGVASVEALALVAPDGIERPWVAARPAAAVAGRLLAAELLLLDLPAAQIVFLD